uniref:uncharacterized protein LOC122604519 n=1 Tax=Erigeron canadensis TaxID=72917 RepID=UPI001CB98411|nr:uncharacterized protein LOC122604519 [Erigeron canadensis]
MAFRLRSLAIKLTSSAAAAHKFTRSTITTYSCYNNVIKASLKPGINSSFVTNYSKFSPYNHARNYSCYNVIRDSIESGINSLAVTKGGEKSTSSIVDDQELKKVIATYTSDAWISMKNLLNKYNQTQIFLNNNGAAVFDFSFLYDHDHVGRLAFASSGGSMGGSDFSSSSSSLSTSSGRGYYSSYSSGSNRRGNHDDAGIALIFCITMLIFILCVIAMLNTPRYSTIKLQVGLSGTARSLQKDLNSICKTADTSGEAGYRYILEEIVAALIRNPDFCITCCSSVDVNTNIAESEKVYRQNFIEERSKIDELTLVNVNNIKKKKATSGRTDGFGSEFIVVTIIVCANGVHSLPPIKNREDFEKALQMLASIQGKIKGVEVLWTPQMKDDILTKEEMVKSYPLLEPLDETVEKWFT